MTSEAAQAGYHKLNYMRIKPLYSDSNRRGRSSSLPDYIDVTRTVVNWMVSESIDSPFISGFVVISESDNLLEDVPLRGEEYIDISWTDFYGVTKTQTFFVYAVEDIKPASSINDRMVQYTLKFTSVQKLLSDVKEIRRSFNKQKISDVAQIIYDEYFKTGNKDLDKEIEIEPTDGEQTIVIPSLRPDAAMQFLSRRAYSSENKTSLYRFFETGEKYFFCTHEYLTNKYSGFEGISEEERNRFIFNYSTLNDNTGDGQRKAQQAINDVAYGTKVDSFADMKDGTYRRNVTELDINYRTRIARQYDYSDEYKEYKAPKDLKLTHSEDFVNTYMPSALAPDTVLITDFPQIGQNKGEQNMLKPYAHYYENYTTKPVVDYHMKRNAFQITINGRHELYAGQIIDLNLYKFANTLAGTKENDAQRSGKYIVLSINATFSGDEFKQTLVITKGGLS